MPSRLDIEFHDLELAISVADPDLCRRAAEAVALTAVQEAELTDGVIDRVLDDLRRGALPDQARRQELEEVFDRLDTDYLELQDRADSTSNPAVDDAVSAAFKQARAANAVLYALSDDPIEAAHEAAYEAHHVLRDPARLRLIVERCLLLR